MNDDIARHFLPPQRRRLLALARGLLGSHRDAEDVVQDAYLRLHDAGGDERESMQAWLSTVVRHLAIDRLRRRRLEGEWLAARHDDSAGDAECAKSAEQVVELALQTAAALRRVAEHLSPVEAAALLLREVFEADYAEIARACGKSEDACRQLVHRALQRVRAAQPRRSTLGGDERESTDALFSLCWRAVENRHAAALFALLAAPPVTASASATSCPAPTAPHTQAALMQIDGRFALALVLDGKLLCTLPIGVSGASADESSLACDAR